MFGFARPAGPDHGPKEDSIVKMRAKPRRPEAQAADIIEFFLNFGSLFLYAIFYGTGLERAVGGGLFDEPRI